MIERQRSIISPIRHLEVGRKKAWSKVPERSWKFEANACSRAVHFEEKIKKELILY